MIVSAHSIPSHFSYDNRFHFSEEQCKVLYTNIAIDDEIDLNADLPKKIHLSYRQEQLIESFLIGRKLWEKGTETEKFLDILQKLVVNPILPHEEQVFYKEVRAKFKNLCYNFINFDARHKRPFLFGNITALMGMLQDAFKNRRPLRTRYNAKILSLLWSKNIVSLFNAEVSRFFPCDTNSFVDNIQKRVIAIHEILENKPQLSAHEFHEIRKYITQIAAIFSTFQTLYPSSYHQEVFHYIATINGLMGDYHDELIRKELNKTQDYFFDRFIIPETIALRLNIFCNRFTQSD